MAIDPTGSPTAASTIAKKAPAPSSQAACVAATYSRASRLPYGLGIWWIQRAISGSLQARAIASTSSTVHGLSVTTPSEIGGSGVLISTAPPYNRVLKPARVRYAVDP